MRLIEILNKQILNESIKNLTLYHMTKKQYVDSILRNGFDITKVRPRWVNDYAISLSKSKKFLIKFFTKGNGTIDSDRILLKVNFRGNIVSENELNEALSEYDKKHQEKIKFDNSGRPVIEKYNHENAAKKYTEKVLKSNIDAVDLNYFTYVYNSKKIFNIKIESF